MLRQYKLFFCLSLVLVLSTTYSNTSSAIHATEKKHDVSLADSQFIVSLPLVKQCCITLQQCLERELTHRGTEYQTVDATKLSLVLPKPPTLTMQQSSVNLVGQLCVETGENTYNQKPFLALNIAVLPQTKLIFDTHYTTENMNQIMESIEEIFEDNCELITAVTCVQQPQLASKLVVLFPFSIDNSDINSSGGLICRYPEEDKRSIAADVWQFEYKQSQIILNGVNVQVFIDFPNALLSETTVQDMGRQLSLWMINKLESLLYSFYSTIDIIQRTANGGPLGTLLPLSDMESVQYIQEYSQMFIKCMFGDDVQFIILPDLNLTTLYRINKNGVELFLIQITPNLVRFHQSLRYEGELIILQDIDFANQILTAMNKYTHGIMSLIEDSMLNKDSKQYEAWKIAKIGENQYTLYQVLTYTLCDSDTYLDTIHGLWQYLLHILHVKNNISHTTDLDTDWQALGAMHLTQELSLRRETFVQDFNEDLGNSDSDMPDSDLYTPTP